MGFVGFVLLLEAFEAARPSCWKRVCQAPKIPLGISTAVILEHPFPRVSGGGNGWESVPRVFPVGRAVIPGGGFFAALAPCALFKPSPGPPLEAKTSQISGMSREFTLLLSASRASFPPCSVEKRPGAAGCAPGAAATPLPISLSFISAPSQLPSLQELHPGGIGAKKGGNESKPGLCLPKPGIAECL